VPERPTGIVATIPPLGAILREIAGERQPVSVLLGSNASPHTYDPRPSDARMTEGALALFYVDETLDGWAAKLPAREKIAVFGLLPQEYLIEYSAEAAEAEADHGHDHAHGDGHSHNPHFWADPLSVRALVPRLVDQLTRLDPEGAAVYTRNGEAFMAELDQLHEALQAELAPCKGTAVALFHPSLDYLLHRYGIMVAAYVEPNPGREVSPQHLQRTIEKLTSAGVRAVFTEPQLPRRPAEVIAEAASLPLFELDPLGGVAGRQTYVELLRYNAALLKKALS
jgi:ABC-type Zn uptake system ZnuABC Zn-binding protein ZnuA